MPGGDRTGPMGSGPMTGLGAGVCVGYGIPGYTSHGSGRGFGRGMGGGRGFGGGGRGRGWGRGMGARFGAWWQNAAVSQPTPVDERQMLEQEASYLKGQIEQVQTRLNQLGESS